jgi:hypothetical protein
MKIRITSHKLALSSRLREFIERKMRVIRRFAGDGVSGKVFLHRNAGTVQGSGLARGQGLRCRGEKFTAFTKTLI